jgi:hypothetical protein
VCIIAARALNTLDAADTLDSEAPRHDWLVSLFFSLHLLTNPHSIQCDMASQQNYQCRTKLLHLGDKRKMASQFSGPYPIYSTTFSGWQNSVYDTLLETQHFYEVIP